MISDNLKSVRQRIQTSCEKTGRLPDSVVLVCVTKEASIDEIEEVLGSGVTILGENRVQDAISKYRVIGKRAAWHLVGHLQTNKAREAVSIFSLIHSVDSIRLAKEIDRQARKVGKAQDILVQINVSGEETKFGIKPDEVFGLLKEISLYPNINVKGLMTIAPETELPETARPYFKALRELRDKIDGTPDAAGRKIGILSMGMTNDFEIALEEGSSMVRIGRAIFRG